MRGQNSVEQQDKQIFGKNVREFAVAAAIPGGRSLRVSGRRSSPGGRSRNKQKTGQTPGNVPAGIIVIWRSLQSTSRSNVHLSTFRNVGRIYDFLYIRNEVQPAKKFAQLPGECRWLTQIQWIGTPGQSYVSFLKNSLYKLCTQNVSDDICGTVFWLCLTMFVRF